MFVDVASVLSSGVEAVVFPLCGVHGMAFQTWRHGPVAWFSLAACSPSRYIDPKW